MNTLLDTLYNLLSYITEDQRQSAIERTSEAFVLLLDDVMTHLEKILD